MQENKLTRPQVVSGVMKALQIQIRHRSVLFLFGNRPPGGHTASRILKTPGPLGVYVLITLIISWHISGDFFSQWHAPSAAPPGSSPWDRENKQGSLFSQTESIRGFLRWRLWGVCKRWATEKRDDRGELNDRANIAWFTSTRGGAHCPPLFSEAQGAYNDLRKYVKKK